MTNFWARQVKTLLPAALVAASALGCAGTSGVVQAPTQPPIQPQTQAQFQPQLRPLSNRGELLYNTHCIACHTTQIHWRDGKQANDWKGIEAQVRRWQGIAGLAWSDADIAEVSRYLNSTIYKYPQTGEVIGLDAVR